MAITDQNTVLILGAGVSVPFGLPVGNNLIDEISDNLKVQLSKFNEACGPYFSVSPLHPVNDRKTFLQFPYIQPLLWKIGAVDENGRISMDQRELTQQLHKEISQMRKLEGLLKNQTSDSIDDFIVMNPSFNDQVKLCIAAEFVTTLYKNDPSSDFTLELKDLESRFVSRGNASSERNWIHRLINLIRLGIADGKVTPNNKIMIITFNYDTILEHVFEQQFANTENGKDDYPNYRDFVEIIHVHGQLGDLSRKLTVPAQNCWEWASGIRVIRENDGDLASEIKADRARAVEIVKTASEIYSCGFAFAKANTDLLELSELASPDWRREIHYCNYSNDIGLKNAAEKFVRKSKNTAIDIVKVVPQINVSASDWIGIGTLGELP